MSTPQPPPWLGHLQSMFGRAIQAPLDATTGTLRSRAAEASPELLALLADGSEPRLALYHEQYWMRIFTAMQHELPRVAQVVGYWRFNGLVTLHVRAAPPTEADMARCADGFVDRLLAVLDGLAKDRPAGHGAPDTRAISSLVPADAVDPWLRALADVPAPLDLGRQAARMDEAVRHALGRPFRGIWRPAPNELATLPVRRLRFAPSFRLLREDWALAERGAPAEASAPFAQHDAARFCISWRAARSTALRRVDPAFARLCGLLVRLPLGEALREMESHTVGETVDRLTVALPGWVELALSSGWWIGVRPESA